MTNESVILSHLAKRSEPLCDDCLSNALNIKPRQQVNQIANLLMFKGRISRRKAQCASCHRTKLVNSTTPWAAA